MGELLRWLMMLGLALVGGVAGGFFAASHADMPTQLAIVDVQALIKQSTLNGQTESDAKQLTQRIKAATTQLVARGIIVIDAQAVIDAPEAAYVSLD